MIFIRKAKRILAVLVLLLALSLTMLPAVSANKSPIIQDIADQAAYVGEEFSYYVHGIDPDSDAIEYYDNTNLFEIDKTTGAIRFVPLAYQIGEYTIAVNVSDGNLSDLKTFRLNILEKENSDAGSKAFELNKNIIRVFLKEGEAKTESIRIKNNKDLQILVNINVKGLEDCIGFSEQSLAIEPLKSQEIPIIFSQCGAVGAHTSEITLSSGAYSDSVKVVEEIESKSRQFDANIEMPAEFRKAIPGSRISEKVSIVNLKNKDSGIYGLKVKYSIKDMSDVVVVEEEENVNSDIGHYVKEIQLPPYIKNGDYLSSVEVFYNGETGVSSELFSVESGEETEVKKYEEVTIVKVDYVPYIIVGIVGVFVIALVFIVHRNIRKVEKEYMRKINRVYRDYSKSRTVKKARKAKEKLLKQKEIIEKAFKQRYIKEDSYRITTARINSLVRELNKRIQGK